MNIRNVSNPSLATDIRNLSETRNVRLDQSHQDRDADGRRQFEEPDQNPLTEEEMQKVKEYFDGLENFKASGLEVKVETSESNLRLFVIRDPMGQVVRRIPEYELRAVIHDKDRKRGAILNRAG